MGAIREALDALMLRKLGRIIQGFNSKIKSGRSLPAAGRLSG